MQRRFQGGILLLIYVIISFGSVKSLGGWTVDVHHQIALEAVNYIDSPWNRVWDEYIDEMVRGVEDAGSWGRITAEYYDPLTGEGGGPQAVDWYFQNMLRNLSDGNWEDAFYSSGVLSYYATNLCDPFNTVEKNIFPPLIHERYSEDVESHFGEFNIIFTMVSEAASDPFSYAVGLASVTRRDYEDLFSIYTYGGGWSEKVEAISQRGVNRALQATVSLWSQCLVLSSVQPPSTTTTMTQTEDTTTTLTLTTSQNEITTNSHDETQTSKSTTTTPLIETITDDRGTSLITTLTSHLNLEDFNHIIDIKIRSDGSGTVQEIFRRELYEEYLEIYRQLGDEGFKDLIETRYAQKGFTVTDISVAIHMDEHILDVRFTIPGIAIREGGYYVVKYDRLMEDVEYWGNEGDSYFFTSEEGEGALIVTVPFYAAYIYRLEGEGKLAYYLAPLPGWEVPAILLGFSLGAFMLKIKRGRRAKKDFYTRT